MKRSTYEIPCPCGRLHRTRETEVVCSCGRTLIVEWPTKPRCVVCDEARRLTA